MEIWHSKLWMGVGGMSWCKNHFKSPFILDIFAANSHTVARMEWSRNNFQRHLGELFNIFFTSSHERQARMQLVFSWPLTSLETLKMQMSFPWFYQKKNKNKGFLEHCDSFSCSFPWKGSELSHALVIWKESFHGDKTLENTWGKSC